MRIPTDVKVAAAASLALLPIFGGIGWVADIFTRDAISMIVVSHGQEIPASMHQSLLWEMWPVMLVIWAIASAVTIAMAWAGLCAFPYPERITPPPPPTFEQWQEMQARSATTTETGEAK